MHTTPTLLQTRHIAGPPRQAISRGTSTFGVPARFCRSQAFGLKQARGKQLSPVYCSSGPVGTEQLGDGRFHWSSSINTASRTLDGGYTTEGSLIDEDAADVVSFRAGSAQFDLILIHSFESLQLDSNPTIPPRP